MFTFNIDRAPHMHPFHLWDTENKEAVLNSDIQERHKRLETKPNNRQYAALARLIESQLDIKETPCDFNSLAPLQSSDTDKEGVKKFILHCRAKGVQPKTFKGLTEPPTSLFKKTSSPETSTPSKVVRDLLKRDVSDYHCYLPSPPKESKQGSHSSVGIYQTEGHRIHSIAGPAEFIPGTLFEDKPQPLAPEKIVINHFKTRSDLEKKQAVENALLSMHEHGKGNMGAKANVMISWVEENKDTESNQDKPLSLNILNGQMGGDCLAFTVVVPEENPTKKTSIRIRKIKSSGPQEKNNLIGCYREHKEALVDYKPEIIADRINFGTNEKVFIVILSPDFIRPTSNELNGFVEKVVANAIDQYHWSPMMAATRLVEIAVQKNNPPGMKTAWVSEISHDLEGPANIGALFSGVKGSAVAKKSAQTFLPVLQSFVDGPLKEAPPFNHWINLKKSYFHNLFQEDEFETTICREFFDEKGQIKPNHEKRWGLLKKLDEYENKETIGPYSQSFFQNVKTLLYPIRENVDLIFQQFLACATHDSNCFRSYRQDCEWLLKKILELSNMQLEATLHELLKNEMEYYLQEVFVSIQDRFKALLDKKFTLFQRLNQLKLQVDALPDGNFKTFCNAFYNYGVDLSKFVLNKPKDEAQSQSLDILSNTFQHASDAMTAVSQNKPVNLADLTDDIIQINQHIFKGKGPPPNPLLYFLGAGLLLLSSLAFLGGTLGICYTAGASFILGSMLASYLFSAGILILSPPTYFAGKFFLNKYKQEMSDSKVNIAHEGTKEFASKINEFKFPAP